MFALMYRYVRLIKISLTLKKKSIMKKTIKTLQMRVIVGVLYSTSLLAQGQGWDFTYLAPSSHSNQGVFFKYGRGKYERAYDAQGTSVKLLAQYGPVKADTLLLDSSQDTGYLVKSTTISNLDYQIISTITNIAGDDRSTFGYLSYDGGAISFNDFTVTAGVKITDVIRFVATLPFFRYTFTNKQVLPDFTDLTPATGNGGFDQNNGNWTVFLKEYTNILAGYGLKTADYTQNAVGDFQCSLLFENVLGEKESVCLDAQVGVVAPTGKRERLDHIFTVDYGHKKQWGGQFGLSVTSLTSDNFQLKIGGNIIVFKESTELVRMYTDAAQSSFIKLGQGRARHALGNKWNMYGTLQFTASNNLFRALVGYACNGQADTMIYPEDQLAFKDHIVNTDPKLKKWSSHTVFAEMSFVKDMDNKYCDQCMVSFLLDYPFAGKNTVKGVRYGGSCGAALKFDF